ncbi:TatD family hydrolase [Estrella lausannensis]|uniref:Putative deoxyribonuclease n=1 Tax=Estrella lausannensis TaxID=483423 RepID=A0A0H5DSW2_9BACT|nr:TatD family hydrolase [Estrella lausannensis]CRX38904.1 Putative deoxyribonuclease [Estrella lausannensis]
MNLSLQKGVAYFDTHAHIASEALFAKADELIAEALAHNVSAIVNIATDSESLSRGFLLQQQHPGLVFNTAAVTPHDSGTFSEETFSYFSKSAKEGKLVAVGETGLDYHYMHASKEIQQNIFSRHLKLAIESDLPIIIHCRDAFSDLFAMLDSEYLPKKRAFPGIMHCFTGTLEEAKEACERGFLISFSGIVTFKKSVGLKEVAKWVPLDRLLIETDSPYLAPEPFRGKTNQPAYIGKTAEMIAALKGITVEKVAEITWENSMKVFGLEGKNHLSR